MSEIREADLRELEPYPDSEVPAALSRLLATPLLERVRQAYFPTLSKTDFKHLIEGIRSAAEFQEQVIAPAIDTMLDRTSDGFSLSGLEKNSKEKKYTYISNHRDIVCDPALFTYALVRRGWGSPLICLGDNLLVNEWITDLVKCNRGVTVKRNLPRRELLRWSQVLSELINRAVRKNELSVWIAQREGRAKDGNDQTHPGLLKMLALSKEDSFLDRIEALHIVPVAISYEYDPVDVFKARELHLSSLPEGYKKGPEDDVRSMGLGIQGFKGRVHIEIGQEIGEAIGKARALSSRMEQVDAVAAEMDRQIHLNYRLWPSNRIAADLLDGTSENSEFYTPEEKEAFLNRLEKQLQQIPEAGDADAKEAITRKILEMYANPVKNAERW